MKNRPIYSWMKPMIISLLLLLTISMYGQDITGQWNGILTAQGGIRLRVAFHITKTNNGYASTMDIPDQNLKGLPITTTSFEGGKLSLATPKLEMLYEGELKNDSIIGTYKQSWVEVPLSLSRKPSEITLAKRPQEPIKPYPYHSEDITFENKAAGVTLAGTLTLPEKGSNFTAVILISGSGAQNRDEEILGHKPFLVISDYLTRNGIAVLRYDDRGVAQSTGNFQTATTADFATDTESAVAYLKSRKEINSKKIGLMGHSEGGVIAPIVAARSKDIAFIVLLAGSGLRGDSLLLLQQRMVAQAVGASESDIQKNSKINASIFNEIVNTDKYLTKEELATYISSNLKDDIMAASADELTADNYEKMLVNSFSNHWMQYFIRYNPASELEKVKCPVLAVIGSKDIQVPAKENLAAIQRALKKGGNKHVTVKEYPGLNHLFQECTTGAPSEYTEIEQTFSPVVLKDLSNWILKQ